MGRPWLSLPTLQNRQNHAFFHVLASNLLKNACFSTFLASKCLKTTHFSMFWLQTCSKTRVFPRFGVKFAQKRVFFRVFPRFWLQNASKQRVFLRFGFRIAEKHAFFHVLASELLKNTRVSMFLPSKWLKATCFPKFWFQHCSKTCIYQIFSLQIATAVFRRFWFEEVQKNTFFPCVLFQNFAMQGVFFQRQAPLHTGASRTKAFTHRRYTHRQSTHRLFCTTNCFTHISFCTPKHLNTSAFYRGL